MPFVLFLQFLAILAVGAGMIYSAGRWKARAGMPAWAGDYFLFLLFFLVTAFVFRFVPHVIEGTLQNATAFSKAYSNLADLLGLPLSFLYILFFVRFAVGFAGSKISARSQRTAIAFGVVVYLVVAANAVGMLRIKAGSLFGRPGALLDLLIFAGLFFGPVWMAARSRRIPDPAERRSVLLFASVHVLCFGAYEGLVLVRGTDIEIGQLLARFVLNVPPWLVLVLRTKRPRTDLPLPEEARMDFQALTGRFGITGREYDVIRLVCLGKSNAEIEKELFISVKTVKRHLYNIYQKTGARNRVQLVNLARISSPESPGPMNTVPPRKGNSGDGNLAA